MSSERELKEPLNSIANRMDRGYSLEVRAGELPELEDEAPGDASDTQLRETVEMVQSVQERLKFPHLSGKPILELPEAADRAAPKAHDG